MDGRGAGAERTAACHGTVHLPNSFTPRTLTDNGVVGVLRDELDVEYVARYRVEGSGDYPRKTI